MTLIERIDGKKVDKLMPDEQGQLHGLFVIHDEYTGNQKWIERVWLPKIARCFLEQHRLLYRLKANEFSCKYTERNWETENGSFDVTICFKWKIDLPKDNFVGWWLVETDALGTPDSISAEKLGTYIIQNAKGNGLAAYVNGCLKSADPKLLSENGANSWPYRKKVFCLKKCLRIVDVEDVECKPHVEPVKKEPVEDVPIRSGTVLCGQYKLVEKLGQGGMGQVWKAEDVKLQQNVAVKILAGNANEVLTTTIKTEARCLSCLSHRNIATMRGYHEHSNVSFMVMDLIEGYSLEDILTREEKFTVPEVIEWLKLIAGAIDYVHGEGIVHRDIKPANIMIGKVASSFTSNETDRPFLCDFGIASKNLNVTQFALGTPCYCAPEIISGAAITAAADIYSFAVTLFRCLTGRFPVPEDFSGLSESDNLLRRVKEGLSSDPSLRPDKCSYFFQKDGEAGAKVVGNPIVSTSGVVLPNEVMMAYECLFARCGKKHIVEKMGSVGKYVKRNGEYVGWKILDTAAFMELMSSIPCISLDEMKENKAADRHLEIISWFGNPENVKKLDSATKIMLQKLLESITQNSEED